MNPNQEEPRYSGLPETASLDANQSHLNAARALALGGLIRSSPAITGLESPLAEMGLPMQLAEQLSALHHDSWPRTSRETPGDQGVEYFRGAQRGDSLAALQFLTELLLSPSWRLQGQDFLPRSSGTARRR